MSNGEPHTSILDIDLPEIPDRNPHTPPTGHLVKKGANEWGVVEGRRASKTLMVNRIRQAVISGGRLTTQDLPRPQP